MRGGAEWKAVDVVGAGLASSPPRNLLGHTRLLLKSAERCDRPPSSRRVVSRARTIAPVFDGLQESNLRPLGSYPVGLLMDGEICSLTITRSKGITVSASWQNSGTYPVRRSAFSVKMSLGLSNCGSDFAGRDAVIAFRRASRDESTPAFFTAVKSADLQAVGLDSSVKASRKTRVRRCCRSTTQAA